MKAPSGTLLTYALILLGAGIYCFTVLPSVAPPFQLVAVLLAVALIALAVLLVVRFRWSPELFVVLFVFMLGWGIVHWLVAGFSVNRLGMSLGALLALFGYP